MPKFVELKPQNPRRIYQEVASVLCDYKDRPQGSVLFLVEGSVQKPIIALRYPGRKLRRRNLKTIRLNSVLWANLYDFEVVVYKNGKEIKGANFTFQKMTEDFYKHKRGNKKFWVMLEELYKNNAITKKSPKLTGIDPWLFLLALKWIWIQEDFNYKLSWEEAGSPVRYVLETRTGSRTSRGAGRAKSFAGFTLLKSGDFTFEQIKKIIPLY